MALAVDRIMGDNKHYQSGKFNGFIDFITKDPPEGYVGKHRVKRHGRTGPVVDQKGNPMELIMGCVYCHRYLEDQKIGLDTTSMRKLLELRESEPATFYDEDS